MHPDGHPSLLAHRRPLAPLLCCLLLGTARADEDGQ